MTRTNKTRQRAERELGKGKRQTNRIIAQGQELNAARLAKEQATARLRELQAEAAKLALAKERGELILRADVEAEIHACAASIKAHLFGWAGNLPGRLEGLTAGEMSMILREEVIKVLLALSKADFSPPKRTA